MGVADERWGWPWMFDVVRALEPEFVVVENVATLLADRDAFGRMLGDLADLGFDAEWDVLSACAVGAPHARERVFVVAYPAGGDGEQLVRLPASIPGRRGGPGAAGGDAGAGGWLPEPDVGRVADGLPKWMVADHLRALGNAVVPQVAEHIGRLVMGAAS
jgi:DNA (cytosine-5)-methyltransferase 1